MEDAPFRDLLAKLALGKESYDHEDETCVISVFNNFRPSQRPTYINGTCTFMLKNCPDGQASDPETEVVEMPEYVDPGMSIAFRPSSSQCVTKCILSIYVCSTDSNGPIGPYTGEAIAEPGQCLLYKGFSIGLSSQISIDKIKSIKNIEYDLKPL
jgi:hypothetical protein